MFGCVVTAVAICGPCCCAVVVVVVFVVILVVVVVVAILVGSCTPRVFPAYVTQCQCCRFIFLVEPNSQIFVNCQI